MSAPKYSAEFKEQVVPRDRSTIPAGGRGRKVLRAGPADRGQLGREMAHRAPRTRDGEFLERGEHRRPRRLKAELREARTETEPPGRKRRPSSSRNPGERQAWIHPQRGRQPPLSGPVRPVGWKHPRSGYYAWRDRPLSATARRRQDLTIIIAGSSPAPDQTLRPPAASGPGPPATESKPARQSIRKIMATNAHDPLAGPGKRPATTAPGRGPSGPTGTDPHRNHAANAPAVTWVGDITYIPTWQRGSPHLATVTGLHPARRIIGYTRGRSHAAPGPISQAPARGSQGLPTGPRRHSVSVPTEDPRTPRTGYAKIMADHEILPSVGRTGICHTQRGGRPLSTAP